MKCVYVICEKNKIFTSSKNKCKTLYVGESKKFEERKKVYEKDCEVDNELKYKLYSYLVVKKKYKEFEKFFLENIEFRIIQSFNFNNDAYRKEVEGYIINRLNPLLNKTKRDSVFGRNFKKFEKDNIKFYDYEEFCDDIFAEWYWNRADIGGTTRIYNRKRRQWYNRNEPYGEEAMNINYDKKYKSWFDKNKLFKKFDAWRTNYDEWEKNLKY